LTSIVLAISHFLQSHYTTELLERKSFFIFIFSVQEAPDFDTPWDKDPE
jgi:hypothetical protein